MAVMSSIRFTKNSERLNVIRPHRRFIGIRVPYRLFITDFTQVLGFSYSCVSWFVGNTDRCLWSWAYLVFVTGSNKARASSRASFEWPKP